MLSKIVFKYIIHNREPKLKSHIIKFFFNLPEYLCLYLHHFSLSAALFSLAYRRAASRRSSLYGAVRRKEKRPFAISNSMQPVSGVCVSLTALVGVLLGISGKPLFEVGVVGADMDKGVFLVKPYISGLFLFGKPCSHASSFLRPCYAIGAFFGCFPRLLTWVKRRF